MEDKKIKRGIDFRNRFWESGLAISMQRAFAWWKGGTLNKLTIVSVFIVFIINLFLVYPFFKRDISSSFSSSYAFLISAGLFGRFLDLDKSQFFSFLGVIALSFAPISFYLFVRRTVLRHELTAFLATLFFILPNPISPLGMPLIGSILAGDGAHAFVFAFIPLFLLYVRAFISTGVPFWGIISALGLALIAIISPFAFFNLLIFSIIITIGEGFLGNLRIKLMRTIFLIVSSLSLAFFWYYPNIIVKVIILSHVKFTIEKLWSVFPLVIPLIPILGALSFLIFDRREKLKPIFISFSLFLIYSFLTLVSKTLNITGIFTADRYSIEFSFASSLFFAVFFVLLGEFAVRNYILKLKNNLLLFLSISVSSALVALLGLINFTNIMIAQAEISNRPILNHYNIGIGSLKRVLDFGDISSVFADLISLVTFIFLIVVLIQFPSLPITKKEVIKEKNV